MHGLAAHIDIMVVIETRRILCVVCVAVDSGIRVKVNPGARINPRRTGLRKRKERAHHEGNVARMAVAIYTAQC